MNKIIIVEKIIIVKKNASFMVKQTVVAENVYRHIHSKETMIVDKSIIVQINVI
jgi:hypothetical protein